MEKVPSWMEKGKREMQWKMGEGARSMELTGGGRG
jgi:hypothetical protein